MTSRMRGVTRKRSEAKGCHIRKAKASDHVVNDFEVSFVELAFVEGIMGPGEGRRSCGRDARSSRLAGTKGYVESRNLDWPQDLIDRGIATLDRKDRPEHMKLEHHLVMRKLLADLSLETLQFLLRDGNPLGWALIVEEHDTTLLIPLGVR